METNIIKIGNSKGVIIPSEFIKSMNLSEKSKVILEQSGEVLMMRAVPQPSRMTEVKFFVCPVCGNVIYGTGDMQLSCHGHNLSPLLAQSPDGRFDVSVETVEDEFFISVEHEMSKQNYISFMAAVSPDHVQLVKLFPEGPAQARFKKSMVRSIYFFSAKDGLFCVKATS